MITTLTKEDLITLEKEREAVAYVLAHPGQKFDEELLRRLFPRAVAMDNFGISSSSDVQEAIDRCRKTWP